MRTQSTQHFFHEHLNDEASLCLQKISRHNFTYNVPDIQSVLIRYCKQISMVSFIVLEGDLEGFCFGQTIRLSIELKG
jgi:hypothetical protein